MISCLFLFILLGVLLRQESSRRAAISYPAVNPSPNAISAPPSISDRVMDLFNIVEALVVHVLPLPRILLDD